MATRRWHLRATLLPEGDRPVDLWIEGGRLTFRPLDDAEELAAPGGYALAGLMKDAPHRFGGRLVALTGYGQAADMAASRQAGFDAHLTKPVDPANVERVLGDLLATGAPRNDASPPGTAHNA